MTTPMMYHFLDHVMSNGETVKLIVTGDDTEMINLYGCGAAMTVVNVVPGLNNSDGTPYLGKLIWLAHELVCGMPEDEVSYFIYHEEAHLIHNDMAVMAAAGGVDNIPADQLAALEMRADNYAIERVGKPAAARGMKKALKILLGAKGWSREDLARTLLTRQPGRFEALMK